MARTESLEIFSMDLTCDSCNKQGRSGTVFRVIPNLSGSRWLCTACLVKFIASGKVILTDEVMVTTAPASERTPLDEGVPIEVDWNE